MTLCAGQGKQEFEKDVEKNIARVKKVIWLKNEDLKKQKKIEALNYMKVRRSVGWGSLIIFNRK